MIADDRRCRSTPGAAAPGGRSAAPGEAGISTLEMAILYPVILMILLGMFQIALYWHTANAAEVAAERGVDVGQVDGGDTGAAEEAALRMLRGTTQARNASVSAAIAGEEITVTVTTDAPRLFGWLGNWTVESVAEGRLERFVPADER